MSKTSPGPARRRGDAGALRVRAPAAQGEIKPHAEKWDEEKIFPVEALRSAAAQGFGGVFVRDDVGGSALKRVDGAVIFEELASGCTSTTACVAQLCNNKTTKPV